MPLQPDALNEVILVTGISGSGKSVTAQAVMGLLPSNMPRPLGQVLFDGRDLGIQLSRHRIREGGTHGHIVIVRLVLRGHDCQCVQLC